ncbi:ABC transporter ATP-binding protein [Cellulosimicrobium funkei]|uniref:ABC transporter ATP-binding protein n=1 Tax=Cellulosimicrobium sp. SL-1 TaxID=2699423 RepID=UPI0013D8BE33|nr:ABC transporter ATP-binding protein [Cellulosimicrobium sp. SL-1]
MPAPAVLVHDLVKRYDGRAVVDGVSLTAERGAITAVLGPNGAGKTTTVECCEGLRSPDAGRVEVLGLHPLTDARELRPRVGVMLQDGGLPTGVRALEMLRHVASMYARPRDVGELTERLGLESFARTTVRRLSGGQRQRLALAAAIVGRPEVVFLDEPSAGMDPQSRHAVWELVRELRAEGVGIVLTTHLMDEAEDLADQVYVVDHGKVIAAGATRDLLESGADGETDRTVRVEATAGLDLSGLRDALAAPDGAPGPGSWTVAEPQPGSYTLTGPADPATLVALTTWLAARGVLASRVTVGRRTLEDVFLDLTGRHLR